MAYGDRPFPDTGCPVPNVADIYLVWKGYIQGLSLSKIGLDKALWTSFIQDLHTKLSIINNDDPAL